VCIIYINIAIEHKSIKLTWWVQYTNLKCMTSEKCSYSVYLGHNITFIDGIVTGFNISCLDYKIKNKEHFKCPSLGQFIVRVTENIKMLFVSH